MNRLWLLSTIAQLPPSAQKYDVEFATNWDAASARLEPEEKILLLAKQADLQLALQAIPEKIVAYRELPEPCEEEQLEYLLHALQADSLLQHDLLAADSVAHSGLRGPHLDDESWENLGQAILAIAACRSMDAVADLLQNACSAILPCEEVVLQIDPPHMPSRDLPRFQLAVPVLHAGELRAHVYVRFAGRPQEREWEKCCELLLGLGDAIALAVERNRMLMQAEQTKAVWEASFDAVADPVLILDKHQKILRANRAYAELANAPLEQLRGKEFSLFPIANLVAAGTSTEFEQAYAGKFFQVFLDPVLAAEPAGQIVMRLRDVSSEHELMNKIVAREQVAEMGVLAASVAHEINNPIGGISAYAQMLRKDAAQGSAQYNDILAIEEAAERCKKIVQTLLALVRKSDDIKCEVVVLDAVKSAVELLTSEAQISHTVIKIHSNNNQIKISANKNRFTQAVFHLLQNSLAAIMARKKLEKFSAVIEISLHETPEFFGLHIADNGDRNFHSLEQESGVATTVAKLIFDESEAILSQEWLSEEKKMLQKIRFPSAANIPS